MEKTTLPPLEGYEGQKETNLAEALGIKKEESKDMIKELSKALKKGETISVRVQSSNGECLRVSLGNVVGIIPGNEVDPDRDVALAGFVGQIIRAKIISLDAQKGEVILSRKMARQEDAEQLLASIKTGDRIKGIVKVILPYGCFVEIGGVTGLLKDRDIAHFPVKAQKTFQIGQQIEVQVTQISKKGRVYLSTKELIPKPGPDSFAKFKPKDTWIGTVRSVHSFGVFVDIEGVEALCTLPATGRVSSGQKVRVKINQVIPEEGKIHGRIDRFLS